MGLSASTAFIFDKNIEIEIQKYTSDLFSRLSWRTNCKSFILIGSPQAEKNEANKRLQPP